MTRHDAVGQAHRKLLVRVLHQPATGRFGELVRRVATCPRPDGTLVETPVELDPAALPIRNLRIFERAKLCAKFVSRGGLARRGYEHSSRDTPCLGSHFVSMSAPPNARNGWKADPYLRRLPL